MKYSSLFRPFCKRSEKSATPKDIPTLAERLLPRLASGFVLLDEYLSPPTQQSQTGGFSRFQRLPQRPLCACCPLGNWLDRKGQCGII